MKFNALKYYLKSIKTLLQNTNYWMIPLVLIRKPILISTKSIKLWVSNLMDIWTLKEVILDHQYEQIRKLKEKDIVIDIGASIGDFSILASINAERVYSFEINDERIFLMKKNIVQNKCSNVEITKKFVTSLNPIFKEKQIIKCNFLKIDCEGGEYKIIKNTSDGVLRKVNHIAFEIHLFNKMMKKQYELLKRKLIRNQFKLVEKDNAVHNYIKFLFASRK
ncbi:hypothetical protein AUK04_01495 [Candidatus Roizmanbacteria bacterium CG2_30_33_16]|uniref:Methyltransferase FkbM domain-containing protein n=4 Tax=Candidatus Roizmaniibacteriota TaxID=1752723 RepID=A0A2H0C2E7_9BACT|nr:hypothetical protein [Candidatus Roizmanbacteria bacterium]OIP85209.1 MAG: hypothetical protein AUK04_01495 [Candidatus Roizmanbacteria bacterium CG2_30_33_16]PIP63929.1 MAG: hypothetical protein COW96_05355 [Candidatus Roizmanbacteria bacterium CG22_combo_CG10-13_8_21_14_all_33_16]PIX73924.1 MAG: hypothetical protein COZ39_01385 [Candidatus Roizmanbacteria bacterium CG_4_10_14_3_um_filter_33_21]PJB89590.1 MAG: hypothetical protein CO083_00500 [Candidatus Roizmanbacteria bacterium CG_4_9_14_